MEYLGTLFAELRAKVARDVVGLDDAMLDLFVGFSCGGHVLLEGPPGTGKTLLARTFATTLGLHFTRLQFTPDLMPADVIGTSLLDAATHGFTFRPGPLFTDVLLADEINRTPPKTQAALLEAMEERQVTVDGKSHKLSGSFFVVATQNPIEYEGTYPLPEAQIDRFMMKVLIPYPAEAEETAILERHLRPAGPATPETAASSRDAHALASGIAATLSRVEMAPPVVGYVSALVRRTRSDARMLLGASPRAGIALAKAARALASVEGRAYATPDDVKRVARPVLRHRLVVRPESEMEGVDAGAVLEEVLASVPVPR